jgi:hypothetical protein
MTGPTLLLSGASVGQRKNLTEGDAVSTKIRATILSSIVFIGAAIAFTGGAGETARAVEAGNIGSAHHISVLAEFPGSGPGFPGSGPHFPRSEPDLPSTGPSFPGSGPSNTGFTWGGRI